MVDARTRTTRRSHQAEDPAQIPAQLTQPPEEPAPGPDESGSWAGQPSAAQRTEQAVTSLRDDLQELIGLLKGRPAQPVTLEERQDALDRARVYVSGLMNERSSYVAAASAESRLNLELQVAGFLTGERADPPQLPADHLGALKR